MSSWTPPIFLDTAEQTLRARITAQVLVPGDAEPDQEIRQWRLAQVDRCLAARQLMPAGTRFLDSGRADAPTLARQVTALV